MTERRQRDRAEEREERARERQSDESERDRAGERASDRATPCSPGPVRSYVTRTASVASRGRSADNRPARRGGRRGATRSTAADTRTLRAARAAWPSDAPRPLCERCGAAGPTTPLRDTADTVLTRLTRAGETGGRGTRPGEGVASQSQGEGVVPQTGQSVEEKQIDGSEPGSKQCKVPEWLVAKPPDGRWQV